MKFKTSLRQIWLAVGLFSLVLPVFLSPEARSGEAFMQIVGVVNIVMFMLSLPCSLCGLPVVFFAWYVLDMNPLSVGGAYLNTFLFFGLGFMQWFWLARIWSPGEPVLQDINLAD